MPLPPRHSARHAAVGSRNVPGAGTDYRVRYSILSRHYCGPCGSADRLIIARTTDAFLGDYMEGVNSHGTLTDIQIADFGFPLLPERAQGGLFLFPAPGLQTKSVLV